MATPTNGELKLMIQNLTKMVEEGFADLKSQVKANTKFRLVATGVLLITDMVLLPVVLYVIIKSIDKLWN